MQRKLDEVEIHYVLNDREPQFEILTEEIKKVLQSKEISIVWVEKDALQRGESGKLCYIVSEIR